MTDLDDPVERDERDLDKNEPDKKIRVPLLWDDDAFVSRVRRIARDKRMTLVSLAEAAGVSEAWLRHGAPRTGRAVDYILRVAQALDADPAELMGFQDRSHTATRDRRLNRLGVVAGLASHLYVALARGGIVEDSDVEAALAAVRQVIDSRAAGSGE